MSKATLRQILEVIPTTGVDPELQIDTDELGPPVYEDLTNRRDFQMSIAPSDDDVAVAIPDCCLLLLFADEPVLVRLADGEQQLRVRHLALGSEDSDHNAIDSNELLISGNGADTADVRILCVGTVP